MLLSCLGLAVTAIRADDILDWNATFREVAQSNVNRSNPGWATRSLAMTNGALYDITMAFNRTHHQFLYTGYAPAGANEQAALAQAAYETLSASYADQQSILDAALSAKLNAIPDGAGKSAGVNFGKQVANTYLQWRHLDGSEISKPYVGNPDPGHWEPDPMHPTQEAWGPGWGDVKTYVLPDSQSIAVPAAPVITSQEYADAFNYVKEVGALNSATRTQDQTEMGLFWAYDRPTMGPPPVFYIRNLTEIAQQVGNSPAENARLFAMASLAMADAGVTSWDVKFTEDLWRPVTAIRRASEDGNPSTEADANWIPLGAPGSDPNDWTDDFTPPFPAYVSGHAAFGGATYETLRLFYGTDLLDFDLTSQELPIPDQQRSFTSFSQAEWENAISRVYLGIHWEFDATAGMDLGNSVAQYVHANHFAVVPEPSAILLSAVGMAVFATITCRRQR